MDHVWMTDPLRVAPFAAVRLAGYTKADQSDILGDGADPFGVADAGLTWLPKEHHFGVRHEGRLRWRTRGCCHCRCRSAVSTPR